MSKNKNVLRMIADGLFDSHEALMERYNAVSRDERDNNSWLLQNLSLCNPHASQRFQ